MENKDSFESQGYLGGFRDYLVYRSHPLFQLTSPLIFGILIPGLAISLFCKNEENCNKDPQYIKQKNQIDFIYQTKIDSLNKEYLKDYCKK